MSAIPILMSKVLLFILLTIIPINPISCSSSSRTILNFETDLFAIPNDKSYSTLVHNRQILSSALQNNSTNTILYIPGLPSSSSSSSSHHSSSNTKKQNTYHLLHGVYASYIHDVTVVIDGILKFHRSPGVRGKKGNVSVDYQGRPLSCIQIDDSENVVFTSSAFFKDGSDGSNGSNSYGYNGEEKSYASTSATYGVRYYDDDNDNNDDTSSSSSLSIPYGERKRGVIDGTGMEWWGLPGFGYLELGEFRPMLFETNRVQNMLIEFLIFKDSPFWTLNLVDVDGLTMRYCSVVARRTNLDGHNLIDLTAFNTDGIDVSGQNVHVHDCDIWNQDDCIAVKDSHLYGISSNMLFERIVASGLGLTIGSIGWTHVRDITFRDCYLYKSYKGIYMKFRPSEGYGIIENVLYQNITIEEPIQWGLWIGPAQQSISGNICKASPCSLCWPTIPFAECNGIKQGTYKNITLRDVEIRDPIGSPGVILSDESNPIQGISFENVVVTRTHNKLLSSSSKTYQSHKMNRMNYFHGLEEPIHDRYTGPFISYGRIFASLILLGILFQLSMFILNGTFSSTSSSSSSIDGMKKGTEGSTNAKATPLLGSSKGIETTVKKYALWAVALLIVVIAVAIRITSTTAQTFMSSYFVCKGVMDGVAYGSTYPVPSCFTDATDSYYNNNINQ